MKRKWFWIAAFLMTAVSLIILSDAKGMAVNHVLCNQERMTEYASVCMKEPEHHKRYGSWDVEYRSDFDVVQFQICYTGFGSQSDERGVYYSPEDSACGLGNELEPKSADEGIKFCGEGDNYTYVEKIIDHWYWYEMHW